MCQTFTYTVPEIHCAHCKETIEQKVSSVRGVESVEVDIGERVVVVHAETDVKDDSLRAALVEAGYAPA